MSAAASITLLETFGLDPLPLRAREAWLAIRGDASVPRHASACRASGSSTLR